MSSHRVVVDGSNIATEGRSLPSLQQLDEAVRAYRDEHPTAEIIVVVDATFAHRISDEERPLFEEAAAHNELVYPPAGAIGRGDAFLLRIADKTDAVVLSNDSFQEFHGEFEWLFTKGRLIGGTPVPGVGWIFVPRTPVRGPKSREAVKEAKRGKARIGSKEASAPMPVPKAPPPRSPKNKDAKGGDSKGPGGGRGGAGGAALESAIAEATEEAVTGADVVGGSSSDGGGNGSGGGGKRKRRRRGGKGKKGGGGSSSSSSSGEAADDGAVASGADAGSGGSGRGGGGGRASLPTVNEPLTFIQFIADHQPGASVEGEVESFASHGAFVLVGEARCYIPLSAMGDPPPRSAREVLGKGETRTFVVQALDAPRRGIELALPGFERVAGQPTDETVEAEIGEAPPPIHHQDEAAPARAKRTRKKAAAGTGAGRGAVAPAARAIAVVPEAPAELPLGLAKKAATKKAATTKKVVAKKAAAAKKTTTKKAAAGAAAAPSSPAKKTTTATKKAAATKSPASTAKKTAAPTKKATGTAASAKKAATAATAAKKVAKKAPAAKAAKAPAEKATAKKAPAKKATAASKSTAAKKAPAKKATAKKAPAKKSS